MRILIFIGILIVVFLGIVYYLKTEISPAYQTLSDDPNYQEVKERYNLSEDQLQILSTVNPQDSE